MVVLRGTALLKALTLKLRSLCPGTVFLPYRLRAADDALHYVVSDLLPIVLVDVEGKNHFSKRGFPILPVLAHHVLQVDGRCTQNESGTRKWAKVGVSTYLSGDPFLARSEMLVRPSLNPWEIPEICEILKINWAVLPACRTGNSTCSDMMIWSRVGAKLIIL